MHQQDNITNIGTVDFPAHLKIPARQCEKAGRKKNGAIVLA